MPKLTLGSVKSAIARVLGKSTSSSEVVDYINEAQEMLVNRGDWRGTVVRYAVCVADAKLTWPRWVEAIRKVTIAKSPAPIANRWYEFAGTGPGNLDDDDSPGLILQDMQEAPTFADISGTGKRLHAISNQTESSGLYICVQGYDENNEWIRTMHSGSLIDGEMLAVNTTGAYSTNYFSNVAAVRKDETAGVVTLSEYDVALAVFAPIGRYEADETAPLYRRSRVPGLADICDCQCDDGYVKVQVQAKLRHIPVVNNNDWLLIGNLPALKSMVLSISKSEKNLPAEAEYYEARAIKELEKELTNHHLGESLPMVDVLDYHTWGAGSIEGVI